MSASDVWVTILAGGAGTRLWPASTAARPKLLLPLASERPLVVDTVERASSLAPPDRVRIVAGSTLAEAISTSTELDASSLLVEPRPRNTAPALAWAAWTIAREDPEAVMVSLHADHVIEPLESFRALVAAAADLARRESLLLTVGARPDRPETGYGYVRPGAPLASTDARAHRVDSFHEKPDEATARGYVARGDLWNTGIFIWKVSVFLDELRRHAPEVGRHLPALEAGDVEAFFEGVTAVSVDVAVLERSDRVGVVEADFAWEDLGSWAALGRRLSPDAEGNTTVGEVHALEATGNVVYTDTAPVVLYGVSDLVVVASGPAVLVTRREHAASLKRLVATLPDELRDAR